MAWEEHVESVTGSYKLDNGTTATGAVKTVSVGMGKLNASAWDVDKIGAIEKALYPLFDKALYKIEKKTTARVQEGF